MNKIYTTDKDKFISYNHYKSNKKNNPHIIFLHGLMSNMEGVKACLIEDYCKVKDYNFTKFDNFGHGKSSGRFTSETISSWLYGLELVLQEFQSDELTLIGSSMGAWVSMLAAIKYPAKVKNLICIAPAPDFTEDSIWKKLPPSKQQEMQSASVLNVAGPHCGSGYPISYKLIEDARNHLLLNLESIKISCPVHLIHGSLDLDIPASVSTQLFDKITSSQMVLKLIKDGEHNLSRQSDLQIIINSLEEILNTNGAVNLKLDYNS